MSVWGHAARRCHRILHCFNVTLNSQRNVGSICPAFQKYHSTLTYVNNSSHVRRIPSQHPPVQRITEVSALVHNGGQLDFRLTQVRFMSRNAGQKKGFFGQLIDNVQQDLAKNKEMKENLKKFREEADKLEQTEALKKAREKYEAIESETSKGTEALKKRIEELSDKVKQTIEEGEKTELGKKSMEWAQEVKKSAEKAAQTVSKSGESIGQSATFRSFSEGVKAVKEEIDETAMARHKPYKAPEKLRKRDGREGMKESERVVEANTEATGMVMHKDSKWYQSWQNFKENNQYVTKMFDLKVKYDESDHLVIRATRAFTDKMSYLFGGVFSKTEMSEVLTEICKMDPTFDKEKFIKECQYDIIPNVLEAVVRGDLEILKDWCHEAPYSMIAQPVKQALAAGYKFDSKILDICNVDIQAAKMLEQGPVLVITFQAQQVMVVRDAKSNVVEGDPEKILRVSHAWVLCRDQSILDPTAAWRVMELQSQPSEQWL